MRRWWKRLHDGYGRFMERQGFGIAVTVCVAVITGTAVWAKPAADPPAPTPPAGDISAAQLMQQSLWSVTPSPAPTEAPRRWQAPVAGLSVLQPYSASMVQSGVTGLWRIHDGVDLACPEGGDVCALADGTVLDAGQDGRLGAWVLIAHGDDVQALYAGMSSSACAPGSKVRMGEVIGQGGPGLLDETNLGPHLHLRVLQEGKAIDPMGLFSVP